MKPKVKKSSMSAAAPETSQTRELTGSTKESTKFGNKKEKASLDG
jgi:hypothetical protein